MTSLRPLYCASETLPPPSRGSENAGAFPPTLSSIPICAFLSSLFRGLVPRNHTRESAGGSTGFIRIFDPGASTRLEGGGIRRARGRLVGEWRANPRVRAG